MMQTGLETFLSKQYRKYKKLRLGILCNQASTHKDLRHISELVLEPTRGLDITCFFGPQHGIRGEKQDNMIESQDGVEPTSGVPVYSLYGTSREPSQAALDKIDAFVVDLQDIGTRIYTFMYTLANCMRAAKTHSKKVIVLDRANPIDGKTVEGNVLEVSFTSFVGQFPICVRHGMSMGELAHLFNEHFQIGCDLEVVPLKNWKRSEGADAWKRHWITPSPNIPAIDSAWAFPATVYFEGTNVSEGRGTTKPFEWIGAPFIRDPDKLAKRLNGLKIHGVYYRPIFFQPTFHKGKDELCGGVQLHITNKKKFQSFEAGLHLLAAIFEMTMQSFAWKQPPYEYEYTKLPIDLIAGTDKMRKAIETGAIKKFIEESYEGLEAFKKIRKKYLLY